MGANCAHTMKDKNNGVLEYYGFKESTIAVVNPSSNNNPTKDNHGKFFKIHEEVLAA